MRMSPKDRGDVRMRKKMLSKKKRKNKNVCLFIDREI